jgi:hypothetical protein
MKVYVAGAISDPNPIKVLHRLGKGIAMGKELLMLGFAPFVPHMDILMHLMAHDDRLTDVKLWYDYSLEWLKVADAVFVLEGSEKSKGTQQEIKTAKELWIPVFYDIDKLIEYGTGSKSW